MQAAATRVLDFFSKYIHFMDDSPAKLNIVQDHFQDSTTCEVTPQSKNSSVSQSSTDCPLRSGSQSWSAKKLRSAALMLNLLSLRRLSWGSDRVKKVEVTVTELESLKSELADLEEREAHLKAQLEHVDELLRSARLSSYLYLRTRWTALPGEPPPIDDADVDDWLPRFVVLHGPCIFFYLMCADLSPQDSTLLSDIVEVGSLPSLTREDDETWHCFYILTRQGLRYECSSASKIQVDAWLGALQDHCKLDSDAKTSNGPSAL